MFCWLFQGIILNRLFKEQRQPGLSPDFVEFIGNTSINDRNQEEYEFRLQVIFSTTNYF